MKKINTIRQTFLQLGVVLTLALILVFLSAAAADHGPAVAVGFNTTRIADFLPDDEEFLVESETNRRILAGNGEKMLIYRTINPDRPVCSSNVASNCIGPEAKFFKSRSCNLQNNCDRSKSGT